MKHLIVRNIGPLREVDINIESINLIIGLQSSGKSCVLKTACYCAWVEKRIELAQTAKEYENGTKFIDDLLSYYKMQSYLSENSYIEYVTPYLQFSYDHKNKKFSFKWKSQRWKYKRPKVSYIPSDRNLVAAIPAYGANSRWIMTICWILWEIGILRGSRRKQRKTFLTWVWGIFMMLKPTVTR